MEDNTSINRFVVCGGIVKVFETMRLAMEEGRSRLVSIRTDCVYVENPREIKERHLVNSKEAILANLGKLKIEKEVHPVQKRTWEETEREDWERIFKEELEKGNGELINGIGGSGKTYLGVQKFKEEEGEKMALRCIHEYCFGTQYWKSSCTKQLTLQALCKWTFGLLPSVALPSMQTLSHPSSHPTGFFGA